MSLKGLLSRQPLIDYISRIKDNQMKNVMLFAVTMSIVAELSAATIKLHGENNLEQISNLKPGSYVVTTGSFKQEANALRQAENLRKKYPYAVSIQKDNPYYLVNVGPIDISRQKMVSKRVSMDSKMSANPPIEEPNPMEGAFFSLKAGSSRGYNNAEQYNTVNQKTGILNNVGENSSADYKKQNIVEIGVGYNKVFKRLMLSLETGYQYRNKQAVGYYNTDQPYQVITTSHDAFFLDFMPAVLLTPKLAVYGRFGMEFTQYSLYFAQLSGNRDWINEYQFARAPRLGAGIKYLVMPNFAISLNYWKTDYDKIEYFQSQTVTDSLTPERKIFAIGINYII